MEAHDTLWGLAQDELFADFSANAADANSLLIFAPCDLTMLPILNMLAMRPLAIGAQRLVLLVPFDLGLASGWAAASQSLRGSPAPLAPARANLSNEIRLAYVALAGTPHAVVDHFIGNLTVTLATCPAGADDALTVLTALQARGLRIYDAVVSDRGFEKFRLQYRTILPRFAPEANVFTVDYALVGYLARVVKLFHMLAASVCRDLLRLPEMSYFVDAAAQVQGDLLFCSDRWVEANVQYNNVGSMSFGGAIGRYAHQSADGLALRFGPQGRNSATAGETNCAFARALLVALYSEMEGMMRGTCKKTPGSPFATSMLSVASDLNEAELLWGVGSKRTIAELFVTPAHARELFTHTQLVASMPITEQLWKLMQVAITTQDEKASETLRKKKRFPIKFMISAQQGVRAWRAAINLMHGDVYAESMAMSSQAITALDSALPMNKFSEATNLLGSASDVLQVRPKGGPEQIGTTPLESFMRVLGIRFLAKDLDDRMSFSKQHLFAPHAGPFYLEANMSRLEKTVSGSPVQSESVAVTQFLYP